MIYLSVVIPCFNEERRLEKNLNIKLDYLKKQKYSWEIILVNDGSTDKTQQIINKFVKNNKFIKYISINPNQGKGNAVKEGMIITKGKYNLFTDVDNSTSMEELSKMLKNMQKNNIIIASRYLKKSKINLKQNFFRRFLSRMGNFFVRIVLGISYKDTQCGFKLFDRKSVEVIFPKLKIKRWGFDLEILSLARKYQLKVLELPVNWKDEGDSKLNPIKAAMQVFIETIKIKWYLLTNKY